MEEVWKPIEGYEGRYEVSNYGRVKSYVIDKQNGKIINGVRSKLGYRVVRLYSCAGESRWYPIHRLVASAFIENPNDFKEINHKDEIKDHNWVGNLEWCDRGYNCNYGTKNARQAEALMCNPYTSMKVGSIDETGKIEYFDSIGEAERQTGCSHSNIVRTLKGRTNHCGNRQWFYC